MYKDGGDTDADFFFIKKKSTSDHDADDHNGGIVRRSPTQRSGCKEYTNRLIFDHAG